MTELQQIEAKISAIAASQDHICRDEGYSPYTRRCHACMSQLSALSWLRVVQSRSRSKT